MIKVMIVEDEPVIRNGIANSLDWESLGCEVMALAENGADAMRKIAQHSVPNIVISDIKMPEMDGLELSDRLLSVYNGIKIILLTGYKDFNYVKQALRMGAANYILKPTDPDELESAIKEAVKDINQRTQMLKEAEDLRNIVQQSKDQLKDKFLYELMFRPLINQDELEKRMQYYGISPSPYWMIGISIDSFAELESYFTEEDINILLYLVRQVFDEVFAGSGLKFSTVYHARCIYAIIESAHCTKDQLFEVLKALCNQVKKQGKFTVSVGVSRVNSCMNQLRHARKQVDRCLEQRIFVGDDQILFYDSLNDGQSDCNNTIDVSDFLNAIKSGENILEEAKKIQESIEQSSSIDYSRNKAFQAIVLGVEAYCADYGKMEDLFNPPMMPLEKITYSKTLTSVSKCFIEIAQRIDEAMKERVSNRYLQAINMAKEYTEAQYAKDINLELIASKVFMSQWHFSKIFKRITGRTYLNYLTEVRINKAKELISSNPELKNYEVSERVGLISVRYFNELFKKVVGLTPSEFRSKCR